VDGNIASEWIGWFKNQEPETVPLMTMNFRDHVWKKSFPAAL